MEQLGLLVEDRTAPLSLDDRSDVLFLQREYFDRAGDAEAALAAAKRALKRAYGLNKARIQGKVAKLYGELGDKSAEREARSAELALYEALPPGQKDPEAEKRVRDALASLGKK